jgi:hypothetical protein
MLSSIEKNQGADAPRSPMHVLVPRAFKMVALVSGVILTGEHARTTNGLKPLENKVFPAIALPAEL